MNYRYDDQNFPFGFKSSVKVYPSRLFWRSRSRCRVRRFLGFACADIMRLGQTSNGLLHQRYQPFGLSFSSPLTFTPPSGSDRHRPLSPKVGWHLASDHGSPTSVQLWEVRKYLPVITTICRGPVNRNLGGNRFPIPVHLGALFWSVRTVWLPLLCSALVLK